MTRLLGLGQIAALEGSAHESAVTLERLAALRQVLEAKLPAAKRGERWVEVERLDAAADAAIAAFRDALPAYEKAASQIAAVCRLGRAAEFAINQARTAAVALGAVTTFDLPTVAGGRLSLPETVLLPAIGGGTIWGTLLPVVSTISY